MLRQLLLADLKRQYELEGRSSTSVDLLSVVLRVLHPRFLPVVLCRLGRAAFVARLPILPHAFTYANILLFGIEVTPRCEIGPGLFFPHTSGTVIGAWRIGTNVTIYQGVTLGSKVLDMSFNAAARPEIGDGVTLGAGSKVLGGVRVGNHATVGANAVVLNPVAPHSTVAGIPAHPVRQTA